MLCSRRLRLRRASPTVGLHSGHRDLLGLVGFMANGVEFKAERRKPSGEKHCDIENLPSLTGVLANFRLHSFNAIWLHAGGAKICSYRGGFNDRGGAATSFSCAKSVSTKLTTTMSASGLFSTRLLGFSPLVTPLPFACNIQQSGNAPS